MVVVQNSVAMCKIDYTYTVIIEIKSKKTLNTDNRVKNYNLNLPCHLYIFDIIHLIKANYEKVLVLEHYPFINKHVVCI